MSGDCTDCTDRERELRVRVNRTRQPSTHTSHVSHRANQPHQGDGGLELKALKHRQTLGGGVGPGVAETFEKVR